MLSIKVPCSSANLGPGYDVLGVGLSIYLELQVELSSISAQSNDSLLNCTVTYEGQESEKVDLAPDRNLITQSALYVLRCHGKHEFPAHTKVHIINPIPLGRGLGSSGAAVVAGIMLGNEVGKLGLSKARILDYCLMIERHPDNVAAAIFGGFVATYLSELDSEMIARVEIPLSEVLPEPAGGLDTGRTPPEPPVGIGHCNELAWGPEIKAIAIIPDFEVKTADARAVLPPNYSKADMIFNMSRLIALTTALAQSPPNPKKVYEAMQDKVHQRYRAPLIPGLRKVLDSISPESHPGLLGICLSGAGPTVLALATKNFEHIADSIIKIMCSHKVKGSDVRCEWRLLEPAKDGALVTGSLD